MTALAAIRAGLVVALLPQLWRQSELTTGAQPHRRARHRRYQPHRNRRSCRPRIERSGGSLPPSVMCSASATIYPKAWRRFRSRPAHERLAAAGAARCAAARDHLVRCHAGRVRAIPRNHLQLISGGLAIFLESASAGSQAAFCDDAGVVRGFPANVMTWLLSGGSLALHHPADFQVLEKQIVDDHCDVLIAPALLALRLAESGVFARPQNAVKAVIGLWRAPDRVASSDNWQDASTTFTDIYLFGEMGLFAARRLADGSPVPIMRDHSARHAAPRVRSPSANHRDAEATLALRGAMVPITAYRKPSGDSLMETTPPDYVDTGYAGAPRSCERRTRYHCAACRDRRRRWLSFCDAGTGRMGQAGSPLAQC